MKDIIKNPFAAILFSFGVLISMNAVMAFILSNFSAGLVLTFVLCIFCFAGSFAALKSKKLFALFMALLFLIFALVSAVFVYGSFDTVNYNEDAVLILGCGVNGEEPGAALKTRLERAVEYCEINKTAVIVVSGGQGDDENISEALAMERYLISRGISEDRIIKEDKATSTKENFEFSLKILNNYFDDKSFSLAVISNEYHLYRAESIAESFGINNATYCHADLPWYLILPNGLRECSVIIYNMIF